MMKNTDNKLLQKALDFAQKIFENDFGGHDFFHTLRVYNMAMKIAQKEGADLTIVGLSALLHDVDDRKLSPATSKNKDNAVGFLTENGVDNGTIQLIVIYPLPFGICNFINITFAIYKFIWTGHLG